MRTRAQSVTWFSRSELRTMTHARVKKVLPMARRAHSSIEKLAGGGQTSNTGTVAASSWLTSLGLNPPPGTVRWHAEISLDVVNRPARVEFDEHRDTRFHIDIYSQEWGFLFCHAGRVSWIRVTDIPFVHGRDDHHLLEHTPALDNIGELLRAVEKRHEIHFFREHAMIRTNVVAAEPVIRRWLLQL